MPLWFWPWTGHLRISQPHPFIVWVFVYTLFRIRCLLNTVLHARNDYAKNHVYHDVYTSSHLEFEQQLYALRVLFLSIPRLPRTPGEVGTAQMVKSVISRWRMQLVLPIPEAQRTLIISLFSRLLAVGSYFRPVGVDHLCVWPAGSVWHRSHHDFSFAGIKTLFENSDYNLTQFHFNLFVESLDAVRLRLCHLTTEPRKTTRNLINTHLLHDGDELVMLNVAPRFTMLN